MDRAGVIGALEAEGWSLSEWTDDPGASYPPHAHRSREVRVVLDGEMTLVVRGVVHELRAGDRLDIAPDEPHEATVGPDGVRYLAGRKP